MKLLFISKRRETDDIYLFQFAPVKPVTWIAGQSIRLEINGHERRFSIVSAPFEKNIAIATRISDSKFKQALNNLKKGEEVDGFNIEGDFVWDKSAKNPVLIAGGIGITPYRSILKQLDIENEPIHALLIYANRNEYFAFSGELEKLKPKHPGLRLEFLAGSRITSEIIDQYKNEFDRSVVYISGPEAAVNDIRSLLLKAGVVESSIKLDQFTGHPGWESQN